MNLVLIEIRYYNNNRGRLWVTMPELSELCYALEKSDSIFSFVVTDKGAIVFPDSMGYNWTKWSAR